MRPSIEIIWFDSMGAKSSSVLVHGPYGSLLIDAGVAIMHKGFPAPLAAKGRWLEEGRNALLSAAGRAEAITITHYHYDHFTDFDPRIYVNRTILAKSPNQYINDSQRRRAEKFYGHVREAFCRDCGLFGEPSGLGLDDYPDPVDSLEEAGRRVIESASRRLEMGRAWFRERARAWGRRPEMLELKSDRIRVEWADGREFDVGGMKVRFTQPLFHGEEYSRVGWVLMVIVECCGWKLLHSSDVDGPVIEDYAEMIAKERPNVLILDGPPTYMLGYRFGLDSLERAIAGAIRILEETRDSLELMIYDHHLPREPNYKKRTEHVWRLASKLGVRLSTAAEVLGQTPAVLRYPGRKLK